MKHELKIKKCYFWNILDKKKLFEVRFNDRDYQVGDTIHFMPLNDDKNGPVPVYPDYKIIYIHSGLGMQEGYVVLGLEAREERR